MKSFRFIVFPMKDLKRGVDYIGVGIGAIIVDDIGNVLLIRRGKKAKNERGKWEFPGGAVEFGDTMATTIKKEIREELGVEIELGDSLPAIDHILPEENQHWVTSCIIAKITKGKPKIMEPETCEKIDWFGVDELGKMTHELSVPTKKYLRYLKNISK